MDDTTPVPKVKSGNRPKRELSAWPDGFELTPLMRMYGIDKGMTEATVDVQWEMFYQGALAHGRRYKDWPAAWRNWCLNWLTYGARQAGPVQTLNPEQCALEWGMLMDQVRSLGANGWGQVCYPSDRAQAAVKAAFGGWVGLCRTAAPDGVLFAKFRKAWSA